MCLCRWEKTESKKKQQRIKARSKEKHIYKHLKWITEEQRDLWNDQYKPIKIPIMKEINRLLKYEYERESKSEYVSGIGSVDWFE